MCIILINKRSIIIKVTNLFNFVNKIVDLNYFIIYYAEKGSASGGVA